MLPRKRIRVRDYAPLSTSISRSKGRSASALLAKLMTACGPLRTKGGSSGPASPRPQETFDPAAGWSTRRWHWRGNENALRVREQKTSRFSSCARAVLPGGRSKCVYPPVTRMYAAGNQLRVESNAGTDGRAGRRQYRYEHPHDLSRKTRGPRRSSDWTPAGTAPDPVLHSRAATNEGITQAWR